MRAQGEGREAHVALGQLLRRYENTILALIRKRRIPPHVTPEDIKQDFLTGVCAHQDIKRLMREKGRFRNWLSTAVRYQICNAWDEYWVQRKGHSLTDHPEAFDVVHSESPEDLCIREEALDTVRYALGRHHEAAKHKRRFEVLRRFLPGPDLDLEERARAQAELGVTANHLSVLIWDLRQKHRQFLFWAVADTLDLDPDDPAAAVSIERELCLYYRALSEHTPPSVQILGADSWTS